MQSKRNKIMETGGKKSKCETGLCPSVVLGESSLFDFMLGDGRIFRMIYVHYLL